MYSNTSLELFYDNLLRGTCNVVRRTHRGICGGDYWHSVRTICRVKLDKAFIFTSV